MSDIKLHLWLMESKPMVVIKLCTSHKNAVIKKFKSICETKKKVMLISFNLSSHFFRYCSLLKFILVFRYLFMSQTDVTNCPPTTEFSVAAKVTCIAYLEFTLYVVFNRHKRRILGNSSGLAVANVVSKHQTCYHECCWSCCRCRYFFLLACDCH